VPILSEGTGSGDYRIHEINRNLGELRSIVIARQLLLNSGLCLSLSFGGFFMMRKSVAFTLLALALLLSIWLAHSKVTQARREAAYRVAIAPVQRDRKRVWLRD
jgi:hypothetical protein